MAGKHALSTGALREALIDNECFSTIQTTSNLGVGSLGTLATSNPGGLQGPGLLKYPGLSTLA